MLLQVALEALAALAYAVFDGVAGIVSLWLAPHSFAHGPWRLAKRVVAPLLAGAAMAAVGAWRVRRGQGSVRLDRFL